MTGSLRQTVLRWRGTSSSQALRLFASSEPVAHPPCPLSKSSIRTGGGMSFRIRKQTSGPLSLPQGASTPIGRNAAAGDQDYASREELRHCALLSQGKAVLITGQGCDPSSPASLPPGARCHGAEGCSFFAGTSPPGYSITSISSMVSPLKLSTLPSLTKFHSMITFSPMASVGTGTSRVT